MVANGRLGIVMTGPQGLGGLRPVGGFPVTCTINQGASQASPTAYTNIVFDVVFSEAVTGFATGDITLSGTAGATTAVVSGSGTTYTVTVSGMTGAGTVIATIAAGVCVSSTTGVANDASTSTDNSVTYSPVSLLDYTIQLSGSYVNEDFSMNVVAGDFLLIAVNYRSVGTQSAAAPAVNTGGGFAQLSGLTSIAASAGYDTVSTTRGASRVDRATASITAQMNSNQLTAHGQLIMRIAGISGAPVQQARFTGDGPGLTCNVSLPSPPGAGRTVIAIIQYGPGDGNGANLAPAAPSGWTKWVDHDNVDKGILVLKANTPQQTLTYSLDGTDTTGGGRDVVIMEFAA